ncbi:hypothetical protein DEM34_00500 [Spiribacter halobius]|uniref:histidine kinase n=2 Tax=Sediminicurvatus halobius TaxID=2182432 RepID=A0A2U2N9Y7_9GAMM|nr:hypothetical protein DEM34_00500 [Spiribacter halobius]
MLREAQRDLQDERAHQAANARERGAILDALPAAIALLDHAGRVHSTNQGWRRHGRPFAGCNARPGDDYLAACRASPDLPDTVAGGLGQRIHALLNGDGESASLEYAVGEKESAYHFRATLAPVLIDGEGGVVLMHADITEQRQLERERQRGQRLEALGQLTGGVAHDFNNLLTVICGNAEILQRGDIPSDETSRLLANLRTAGERATRLTRHLLAFARQQPLAPERLDLCRHLEGQRELLQQSVTEAVTLELCLADTPCITRVDPGQLDAAILNLAVNARDAMPGGGHLRIAVDHAAPRDPEIPPGSGPYVRLRVVDTGAGMPPEVRDRIFDPFFTTKPRAHGTGLGLSMVHGFVRQSGGDLSVRSEPGAGTAITLLLPRIPGVEAKAVAPVPGGEDACSGAHVLVVEDDPLVRDYVVTLLGGLGYSVSAAGDAAEALATLEASTPLPDLMFSDVVMPGGQDGHQLAAEVARRWPAVRVLLASGYLERDAGEPPPGQTPHFIPKPYRRATLAAKLAEILGTQ